MATKFFNRFIVPALILGMLFFTSGTSAFAVVPCDWILQYNPDPDPNANQLRAVWGPSATEVFAVGDYGTILYTSDNGATWAAMTSGLTVNIYGVWGSSAANVFAVGDSGNIRKYDGSTWSAMTSGTTKRLRDVWGSTASNINIIAVGEDGTIRKFNGTSWDSMTSNTTLTLQGVWGSSATNIFAVGGAKDGQTGSAIVQKYNGTAWSNILTYTSIPRFHDAWGTSDTNVYVVGEAGTILHTTDGGTNWTAMPVPTGVNTVTLRDIWGTSDSDIFAVGDGPAVPNGSTILHYDGSAWSISGHPRDDKIVRLHGVWGSAPDNFFAVGQEYIDPDGITKHGTIEHYFGSCPTLISLSSFTVTPFSKAVVLEWTTASEIDNAGFNVYRAESDEGPYLKINEDLIFAQGSSTDGSSYEFVDEGLKNRKTYYYQLEDIDLNGQSTFHGPIKATPRWIYGNK